MFRQRSNSSNLSINKLQSSGSIDEDNMSVRSRSSTLSNLASKIAKPRLPSFRKSSSKKAMALAKSEDAENFPSNCQQPQQQRQQQPFAFYETVDCSVVNEGEEEGDEDLPSFCVQETRQQNPPPALPARAPSTSVAPVQMAKQPVLSERVPFQQQQRAQPASPPTKYKATAPQRALEGSFLEDGRAEREAMIDALKMQLAQALEELESQDRARMNWGESQGTILALKTQLEMTQMDLHDSEEARNKLKQEAALAQQLKLELDQVKQELEVSKRSKAKLMEMHAQEKQRWAANNAANSQSLSSLDNNNCSFRRADPSELALRAQNQQLQNQVLRLEGDVARLKTKLLTNEDPETASMKERRLREQDDQFQRAVNAARQLFVEGTISKSEYEQIVQSAERVSLAYL